MSAESWDQSYNITKFLCPLLLCFLSKNTPNLLPQNIQPLSSKDSRGRAGWVSLGLFLIRLSGTCQLGSQWPRHLPTYDLFGWPGLPHSMATGFLESCITLYDKASEVICCHFLPETEVHPNERGKRQTHLSMSKVSMSYLNEKIWKSGSCCSPSEIK